MSSNSEFAPGQEVILHSGARGVLFARTAPIRKRSHQQDSSPTWYFLPDGAGSVGMVVMSQPHQIEENQIASALGMRPGRWPSKDHRLLDSARQSVYVAHMRGTPLEDVILD